MTYLIFELLNPLNLEQYMRFILNFIFYGILFYAIYLAFPEAFMKLVSWANTIYEFLRDIFVQLWARLQELRGTPKGGEAVPPHQALILIPLWVASKIKYR